MLHDDAMVGIYVIGLQWNNHVLFSNYYQSSTKIEILTDFIPNYTRLASSWLNKIVQNELNGNYTFNFAALVLYNMHVFSNSDFIIYAKKNQRKMSSKSSMRNLNFIMMVWYDQFRLWNKNTRTCFRIVSLQHMYKKHTKNPKFENIFSIIILHEISSIHTRSAIAIFWVGKRGLIIVLCCRLDNS